MQFTPGGGRSAAMDTEEEEVQEWEYGDRDEDVLSPETQEMICDGL